VARIGETGGDTIEVAGQFTAPLSLVRDAWTTTLPAVFG